MATAGAISSIIGLQVSAFTPMAKSLGLGARAVPGLGSALAALGFAGDALQAYQDYEKCMAGQ